MSLFGRLFSRSSRHEPARSSDGDLFDDDFMRKLETLALTSRRAASGMRRGERRSRKKGSGVEFADHRNYVAGDDIRFLDFAIYQRFGKLLIRQFEEEEDLSLYFLVDCSASMGARGGEKLRQAKRVTAALAYIGLTSLDRVSVVGVGDRILRRMPPTRGKQRIFRILRFLSELEAGGATDLGAALKTFVAQHRRRGMAILLTDLFDPAGFEAGINVLRFNRFEVAVLEIASPEDFVIDAGGDLRLFDVETGQGREVTMTDKLQREVLAEVQKRQRFVERFCASRGVPFFRVDAQMPFDEVVLSVLRAGGLTR